MAITHQGRTAELSHASGTILGAHETIRPLHDYIVVEPLPVEHSDTLQVIEWTKPLRGVVRAVGPGTYPKRYDHPDKHRRTKMWRSRHFQATEVRVGDIVELGATMDEGRPRGYAFHEILWGGIKHVICREVDVAGVERAS